MLCKVLGLEDLDPFHRVSEQAPSLTSIEEGGDDKRLVQRELCFETHITASV